MLEPVAPTFETIERTVVLGDEYEELLAAQEPGFDYPELDDRQAAGLCYTSGTTGNPKGVLYSHRSNVLHAIGKCLADAEGIGRNDRVLPVVPMFHANAWGFPYACAMMGSSMVMPSRFVTAERLAAAIESESVTVAGAVPTVWLDLLAMPTASSPTCRACGCWSAVARRCPSR